MKDMFAQGGQGSVGIKTNKQAIARANKVRVGQVAYFSVGLVLDGYKVLYNKETQRSYHLPVLPTGTTAISLVNGVLTHSGGSADLAQLALSRGEYNTVQGSFTVGALVEESNDVVTDGNTLYRWVGVFPKMVAAGENPETNVNWVSPFRTQLDALSLPVTPDYESVTGMIASAKLRVGDICTTLRNVHGAICNAMWKIASTADNTTYSKALSNGLFANLMPRCYEEYSSFGFGSTTDETLNQAATLEAHRVANLKSHMCSLEFPAGAFPITTTRLNVARRGFRFAGKGFDITTLNYVGVALEDSIELVLNDATPLLTRQHFYQILEELTINGGMEQDKYASSVAINGHYPRLNFKTIGHFYVNADLNGLSCSRAFIHSQGRTSPTNPAYATRVGVSVNYNAWDITGYLSNGIAGRACVKIDAWTTTLASATSIGATTITVADASGFRRHMILELDPIGGDATLEAPSVKSIAGNVITLFEPLTKAHGSGVVVRMSISGVNITGAQMEVGDLLIGNCNNVNITGNYLEGARPVITGYPRKLNISNNVIAETDSFINQVNRLSEIRYVDNEQNFPVRIAVANRSGSVDTFVDLYNLPLLEIHGQTRKQGAITINETVAETTPMTGNGIYLQSLRTYDVYDRMTTDRGMRTMEFDGLFAYATAGSNHTVLSLYNVLPSGVTINGYVFNIEATMRRETNIIPGYAHIVATAYNQNGTVGVENKTVASLYGALWNDTTGVRILAGATTSRANLVCFGEAAGGQATRFALSGKISCVV